MIALLLALLAPLPCGSFELQDDASLICDGMTYWEGEYVLQHDPDDGEVSGASAYRTTCDEQDTVPCRLFELRLGIDYRMAR